MFLPRETDQMERETCSYLGCALGMNPGWLAESETDVNRDYYGTGGLKTGVVPLVVTPTATTTPTAAQLSMAVPPVSVRSTMSAQPTHDSISYNATGILGSTHHRRPPPPPNPTRHCPNHRNHVARRPGYQEQYLFQQQAVICLRQCIEVLSCFLFTVVFR